jgi:hypothetical protein
VYEAVLKASAPATSLIVAELGVGDRDLGVMRAHTVMVPATLEHEVTATSNLAPNPLWREVFDRSGADP